MKALPRFERDLILEILLVLAPRQHSAHALRNQRRVGTEVLVLAVIPWARASDVVQKLSHSAIIEEDARNVCDCVQCDFVSSLSGICACMSARCGAHARTHTGPSVCMPSTHMSHPDATTRRAALRHHGR